MWPVNSPTAVLIARSSLALLDTGHFISIFETTKISGTHFNDAPNTFFNIHSVLNLFCVETALTEFSMSFYSFGLLMLLQTQMTEYLLLQLTRSVTADKFLDDVFTCSWRVKQKVLILSTV
jgi:hypothetical protein